MKRFVTAASLLIFLSFAVLTQTPRTGKIKDRHWMKEFPASHCLANTDSRYDRQKILQQFADQLSVSIPEYKSFDSSGFFIKNERAVNFFINDLVDTSNKQTLNKCIDFRDGHIYHFAPIQVPFSFSNIAFLENGKIRLFKSINCLGRGDTLNDVISYAKESLKGRPDLDDTLLRIKEYRKYGSYHTTDDDVVRCIEIK